MANVTRYHPIEDIFNDLTRGFWVKPLQAPGGAELKMKVDVRRTTSPTPCMPRFPA
jgi:hypothetical protein